MSKNIFLFSGQGSQYVGMAKELCDKYPAAKAVFDTANEVLGYDIAEICFNGPDTELNKTINSQPAIMACSLAAFEAAKQNTNAPTVIEFMIDREINVMPIVPPGNALRDMILEREENRE